MNGVRGRPDPKGTAVADTAEALDDEIVDPVSGRISDQKDLPKRSLTHAKERGVGLNGPAFAQSAHEERA